MSRGDATVWPPRWDWRTAARRLLARTGQIDHVRAWRRRRVLCARLSPDTDRERHRWAVDVASKRSLYLGRLSATGGGATHERLSEFFESFAVVDCGIPLVRVGAERDGGYLIPDDVHGLAAVFSPGVETETRFEQAFLDRDVPCFLADGSVPGPPTRHPLQTFERLFLGSTTRPGWTSLSDWVTRCAPSSGDLILQMDIEGSEWEVISSTERDTLRRFRLLVVEMHDLHLLATDLGLRTVSEGFRRLADDFHLVHAHPNNNEFPVDYLSFELNPVVETTWLRKDRAHHVSAVKKLAHPLDRANDRQLPDFPLDPRWA